MPAANATSKATSNATRKVTATATNRAVGRSVSPRQLPRGPVMVSVSGLTLSAQDRKRLQHPLVGGVILFAANFRSRRQVTELCAQISALRSPRLLITVDHEGGRVQRFARGFTTIPPMASLGKLWHKNPEAACIEATRLGSVIGSELLSVGVDLSFTPVLDLAYGHSAIIGNRAFDSDPKVVARLARALSHGLLLAGMGNCGKHFPGHGFAEADSHVDLPIDKRSRRTLLTHDAAPYRWLGETLLSVMPAHIIYPKVDSKPAGFSKVWLKDILRGDMQFDGIIFSDDLTMEGAAVAGDMHARAKAALRAGCDMVLVCKCEPADRLLEQLQWRAPRGFQDRLARLFRQTV